MNTTQKWQEHQTLLSITRMIIDAYLSHEVGTNVARLRFFLRVDQRMDRLQIEQVINNLLNSKFVYVENYYDGSQTLFLKPKLEPVPFASVMGELSSLKNE
jgi:predicted nucleic-acid-binding protein